MARRIHMAARASLIEKTRIYGAEAGALSRLAIKPRRTIP
jgi:hypothetical protein